MGEIDSLLLKEPLKLLLIQISRARYILEIKGHENDFKDGARPDDMIYSNQLRQQLNEQTTVEDVDAFIEDLKEQTQFIKDQIEQSIDTYPIIKLQVDY